MNLEFRDEDLIALIEQLSAEGLVNFQVSSEPSSFSGYLADVKRSWWMYAILTLALGETLLVEYEPVDSILVSCRLILGLALLGFIPGYSAFRLTFPSSSLSLLERIVLSVFLSILIAILTGTLLGSVDALEATSNVLTLTVFAFVLSIGAAYRSFEVSGRKRVRKG